MIFDTLANAAQYKGLHAGIDQVLEAAKAYNAENYPEKTRVTLDGDNVFMNMAAYETHATETAVFEAHKQYIDVMVMVEGTETIYVKATDALSHVYQEYKPEVEALLADFDTVLSVGLLDRAATLRDKLAAERAAAEAAKQAAAEAERAAAAADPFVAEILAAIDARKAAKKEKNFAEADRIRDELAAKGVTLIDTPQGTTYKIN